MLDAHRPVRLPSVDRPRIGQAGDALMIADAAQPAGPLLLRGLTLQVVAGARVAIVGENGAGKSTLVGLISGAPQPTPGRVHIAPGAGIGVVSQHQLERLQRHLDQTPLDVLRFEAGEAQPPPRDQVSRS